MEGGSVNNPFEHSLITTDNASAAAGSSAQTQTRMMDEVNQTRMANSEQRSSDRLSTLDQWIPPIEGGLMLAGGAVAFTLLLPEEGVVAGVLAGAWMTVPLLPFAGMTGPYVARGINDVIDMASLKVR
jgi:hypothetical protein